MQPQWPIQTERLVLRPYTEADFDGLHALFSDESVVRWLYEGTTTPEESKQKLARRIEGHALTEEQGLNAAVELRDGTYAGDVALFYMAPAKHRSIELGFSFLPSRQGNGYATEAARALVAWAFSIGFHRVYGRLEPRNAASARVLEKLGMRHEGTLVENEWVKGEWQSEAVYAILDREWV